MQQFTKRCYNDVAYFLIYSVFEAEMIMTKLFFHGLQRGETQIMKSSM